MPDYSKYQGPSAEWEALGLSNPTPTATSMSPEELRTATNKFRYNASQADLKSTPSLAQNVTWRDYSILTADAQNIITRVYRPRIPSEDPLPVYLFFHGGGHLFGAVETEDATCARLVAEFPWPGLIVVHTSVRHTPEATYPTQFSDAWDAYSWLVAHVVELGGDPSCVVVGGISAGAGLAASVALRRCGQEPVAGTAVTPADASGIKGLVLCIPWLVLHAGPRAFGEDEQTSSFGQNEHAPVLPRVLLKLFSDLLQVYRSADTSLVDLTASSDEVLSKMPKASFIVAGRDPLRDEGLYFAERLKKNGVDTKVHVFPGLPHAFRRFSELPSSKRWDDLVVESVRWCLDDESKPAFAVEGAVV